MKYMYLFPLKKNVLAVGLALLMSQYSLAFSDRQFVALWDSPRYLALLQKAETGNDPQASLTLAMLENQLRHSHVQPRFNWLTKAADQGSVEAMYRKGQFLLSHGIAFRLRWIDRKEAFENFQNAANLGHADAAASLGFMFMNGDRGYRIMDGPDYQSAALWLRRAMDLGSGRAWTLMGILHFEKRLSYSDDDLAHMFFEVGKNSYQDPLALEYMAVMYRDGRVPKKPADFLKYVQLRREAKELREKNDAEENIRWIKLCQTYFDDTEACEFFRPHK